MATEVIRTKADSFVRPLTGSAPVSYSPAGLGSMRLRPLAWTTQDAPPERAEPVFDAEGNADGSDMAVKSATSETIPVTRFRSPSNTSLLRRTGREHS